MKKLLLFAMLLLMGASLQAQNTVKDDTHSLKILYLFAADLSEAHEPYTDVLEEGANYSIPSPAIEGYSPDKAVVEGKMLDRDIVDTVRYTVNASATYEVTTLSNPEEGGTTTGGGTFEEGEECTVTAEANDGYHFVNWTENDEEVSPRPTYTFTVDHDRSLVANFEQDPPQPTTHTVSIAPLIIHGTVTLSPSGEVAVGTRVTITAMPDEGYVLDAILAYNEDDVSETVEIEDNAFIMPDFDVVVTASFEQEGSLPVIHDDIATPATICAGNGLELTAPAVSDADEQGWQMSATVGFEEIIAYTGQTLDATYNGWKLRYMASNALGVVYSNVVDITVKDFDGLALIGDANSCTGLECGYRLTGAGQATINWTVSDATAIVTDAGDGITVLWGTKGVQTVKASVEDIETGCSAEVELDVTVQSYVNDNDVNDIVAKKHDGKAYLLIYPNPKDTYKYQWYKDGEAIAGANGQYYYPTDGLADGVYRVYISFNADAQGNLFCGAYSPSITVGESKVDFMVYPNPAHPNHGLVVVNNTGRSAELSIYSIDGRLLHSQTMAAGQEIVTEPMPQGVYVLQLNDGLETRVEKVVIQ